MAFNKGSLIFAGLVSIVFLATSVQKTTGKVTSYNETCPGTSKKGDVWQVKDGCSQCKCNGDSYECETCARLGEVDGMEIVQDLTEDFPYCCGGDYMVKENYQKHTPCPQGMAVGETWIAQGCVTCTCGDNTMECRTCTVIQPPEGFQLISTAPEGSEYPECCSSKIEKMPEMPIVEEDKNVQDVGNESEAVDN